MDEHGNRKRINMGKYIDEIVTIGTTFPSRYAADRLLKKHFESTFGVCDHSATGGYGNRPLLGMAHLPGNSIGGYADIDYLLDKYEDLKIHSITNESFTWYSNLTPARMVQVDETCRRIKERRDREAARKAQEEANAVNNALNGKGQKKQGM